MKLCLKTGKNKINSWGFSSGIPGLFPVPCTMEMKEEEKEAKDNRGRTEEEGAGGRNFVSCL